MKSQSFKYHLYFLGGGAECLINPNIKYIINKIRSEKREVTDDVLITNGYSLTDEIISLLLDLRWEKVFVSLDASSEAMYKSIRGKDLNHVENRLLNLVKEKRARHSMFPIIRVSFVVMKENEHEMEEFFNKWKPYVDIVDFQELTIYSGNMSIVHNLPDKDATCLQPFTRLMVDSFGDIYPCCTEYNMYYKLGNIMNTTLLDAWNSGIINELRNSMKKKQLSDVCKTCMR